MSDRIGRLLLVLAAVPACAYAIWLLVPPALEDWWGLSSWLIGGVVVHDLLLAPVIIGIGIASRKLPVPVRAPAAVALIVWGSITLLAVPVLGRFGALEDNPTLLDRPYLISWLVASALTMLLVALAGVVRGKRSLSHG